MNTPDQLEALRAHLDAALAGLGDSLPPAAAPALLQTARRRNRSRRIAAAAGSVAVIAALVAGVGSQLSNSAGRNPSVIAPATEGPTPDPGTTGGPPAAPSVAPDAGLRVLAQRSIDPHYLGQSNDVQQVFGASAYLLGPGADEGEHAPAGLTRIDLASGDQGSLFRGVPEPVGSFTVLDGKIYVPEEANGVRMIAIYSADDGARLGGPPIVATGGSDQITDTSVAALGHSVLVTTPARGNTVDVLTIAPGTGTSSYGDSIAAPDVTIAGSVGDTAYLTTQGEIYAYRGGKVLATHLLPSGGVVTVSPIGVYLSTRSDVGGPDPTVPTVLTLQRLDPGTLQPTATTTDTLARGVTTPGLSAAVVGSDLYTTVGTCPTAPVGDVCVQRRDPASLAVTGIALRTAGPTGSVASLVQSTDGTVSLQIVGAGRESEQIDLLGGASGG